MYMIYACNYVHIAADTVMFNPGPVNTTVVEGQTAIFTCEPQVNRIPGLSLWDLAPPDSNIRGVSRRNTTIYPGVSGVFLSKDRTTLLLVGVQRRFDGATVICDGTNEVAQIPRVSSMPAYLTVLGKCTCNPVLNIRLSIICIILHAPALD